MNSVPISITRWLSQTAVIAVHDQRFERDVKLSYSQVQEHHPRPHDLDRCPYSTSTLRLASLNTALHNVL